MKREIKFRAWDIYKKVFIPTDLWAVCQNEFNALGIMLKDWENYKEGEYFYSNSQVLMQFTGLKDKNGKDIYEGDILKFKNGEHIKFYNVFSVPGGFAINTHQSDFSKVNTPLYESTADMQTSSWIEGSLEVIGNLFKNRELLK